MSDHYRVKFRRNGDWVYGTVRNVYKSTPRNYPEVEAAERGMLIVDDVILPVCYEVAEAEVIDIPYDYKADYREDEVNAYIEQRFETAKKTSDSIPEGTVAPGSMFYIGVADGQAFYVVTEVREDENKCEVEWRGYGGLDGYQDHWFGLGGTFPLDRVAKYVNAAQAAHRLFGG